MEESPLLRCAHTQKNRKELLHPIEQAVGEGPSATAHGPVESEQVVGDPLSAAVHSPVEELGQGRSECRGRPWEEPYGSGMEPRPDPQEGNVAKDSYHPSTADASETAETCLSGGCSDTPRSQDEGWWRKEELFPKATEWWHLARDLDGDAAPLLPSPFPARPAFSGRSSSSRIRARRRRALACWRGACRIVGGSLIHWTEASADRPPKFKGAAFIWVSPQRRRPRDSSTSVFSVSLPGSLGDAAAPAVSAPRRWPRW